MTSHLCPIVLPTHFIEATRDSGYKTTGSAIAELIDNSLEAGATRIEVDISGENQESGRSVMVIVSDNGCGMDHDTLRKSLQFGWSSRFNQRSSMGRYGMGLPNASLSQARRVDVYSKERNGTPRWVYLDVDEVASGTQKQIPPAVLVNSKEFVALHKFRHGTSVVWTRCDRLAARKLGPLTRALEQELGRLFRYPLWSGTKISLNGREIVPIDPLFHKTGGGLVGAKQYGPELTFDVVLSNDGKAQRQSTVIVKFTELPISHWSSMSNEEKNRYGIAKRAGISVVRAGREIDNGWFFMESKRKENYDDWWRCEVRFEPHLDELFGVTHTKQEIRPDKRLKSILGPDIEKIARELNARARNSFVAVKATKPTSTAARQASLRDNCLEPPSESSVAGFRTSPSTVLQRKAAVPGLDYRIAPETLSTPDIFALEVNRRELVLKINKEHPFFTSLYRPCLDGQPVTGKQMLDALELLLLAAGRAETVVKTAQEKTWAQTFRRAWSNALAAFLG